jgi:hypothetical protein
VATELIPKEKTLPTTRRRSGPSWARSGGRHPAFNSAAEILTRDDFYREAHRRIFDAMAALAERSAPSTSSP